MKPGDFLLGVQDFFAVLLPGTVATWLVAQYLPPTIQRNLNLIDNTVQDQATRWVLYLAISYLLGHFVFLLGSKLDGFYDCWRKRNKPKEKDRPYALAKALQSRITEQLTDESISTLKWTRSFIQICCPAARVEIDLLEATSKLFRGMVIISIALTLHFLLSERAFWLATASIVLAVLSFQRFCDLRWKLTEMSYATAVILDALGKASPDTSVKQSSSE